MDRCDACGRFREDGGDPHPGRDSCPHDDPSLYDGSPDESLFDAVRKTVPGNSVALRGWSASYPLFRQVSETRMWTPSQYEVGETGSLDYSCWKKVIKTVPEEGTFYRIEYDPGSPTLLDWYKVTDGSSKVATGDFHAFLRRDAGDVSYFGATR